MNLKKREKLMLDPSIGRVVAVSPLVLPLKVEWWMWTDLGWCGEMRFRKIEEEDVVVVGRQCLDYVRWV
ncbi:hypothetical protein KY285_005119 [Solanum tuberosum]|nr:hypothetical protein KY285_005119 [Solanum tuberosum]